MTGYNVYDDGMRFRVSSTGYTVQNADCGQSVVISVTAYDAANNRSSPASAIVSTAPCGDLQPPSAPSGFVQAATTQTSAVIEWAPATDNVGVVRYGVYRGVQTVGAPTSPSAALTGLSCGLSTHSRSTRWMQRATARLAPPFGSLRRNARTGRRRLYRRA